VQILWINNNSCHINKTKNAFEEHFATCNKWRDKRKQQYQSIKGRKNTTLESKENTEKKT